MLKEELFNYFNSFCNLSDSSFNSFWQITKIESLKSGDMFLTPESNQDKMGIILSGALKSYFLTYEGSHHIRAFLSKFDVSAAFSSIQLEYRPNLFVEAIEESKVLSFNYIDFKNISESVTELKDLSYKMLEIEFIKNEKKEYQFATKSIEDNFRIINQELELKNLKIMQKDIANYLGITDIAYSRIKKRIM